MEIPPPTVARYVPESDAAHLERVVRDRIAPKLAAVLRDGADPRNEPILTALRRHMELPPIGSSDQALTAEQVAELLGQASDLREAVREIGLALIRARDLPPSSPPQPHA
jgi:hypothetical protein